jgi:hypothetical protein
MFQQPISYSWTWEEVEEYAREILAKTPEHCVAVLYADDLLIGNGIVRDVEWQAYFLAVKARIEQLEPPTNA